MVAYGRMTRPSGWGRWLGGSGAHGGQGDAKGNVVREVMRLAPSFIGAGGGAVGWHGEDGVGVGVVRARMVAGQGRVGGGGRRHAWGKEMVDFPSVCCELHGTGRLRTGGPREAIARANGKWARGAAGRG
ncbi:hypothetical protein E2562_027765 [Oryza meyeriana var. granulata]|uniref:DUF834 domain-containing protein n=1 Tax=Oryza meyeriana var. granulata TaxID=110450 RepID=A0A6G1EBI2_9ORYZ|nr:hypothetical protein E2562_027765 [Oryza meyeriana var. granulata]